ncbi:MULTISPECIES: HAD domain-containing protein [unclassified Streptomyces]|uniref:HAD domain-containing protein n=1 Tax=unclassified Streptomyces TaxID=2593676 RepID=UPI002E2916D5|nr:HAD domain-containing protein [Streptomyces sp. NBC_01423]WSX89427.1 HAD domain-containing protein [Streptomyces sp. NBC_00891]WSY03906.1 HAD domain-containing protein [Streptomyces sp. NBC_00890]WSZ05532.1 HAD domain-containing protein [Streptomyces sp. NBC_00869]WSZ26972.1 HAD domain-containing protein [Streptomyces sp. NBC_00870]
MTAPDASPLLFLDVDGPLIPFGPRSGGHRTYPQGPLPPGAGAHPLLARIDPALGPLLGGLPCVLVWATTWADEANTVVAPRLGLPVLDVVAWPDAPEQEERDTRAGLHWKTRTLVNRAAGRAFVWVDDEIGEADRRWVAAHHGGPALLHRVDPALGLTGDDLRLIGAWLRSV